MKVLFIGVDGYENISSGLRRLGHDVLAVNPFDALPDLPADLAARWAWKSGGLGLAGRVERHVKDVIGDASFDLALVLRGELIGPRLLSQLPAKIRVNFNNDHPFGSRDGNRWRLFKKALPLYDLFVSPRQVTLDSAAIHGAQRVLKVHLWADELVHRPVDRLSVPEAVRSDVAFVGTWMPERGPFMVRLIELGVPLTIFGNRWNRAPEYKNLRSVVRLGGLSPKKYAQAVSGSQIAIVMLSKGNLDLHTRRSNEIPALQRVLCGKRTADHLDMYRENIEAIFWDSPEECASICLSLLEDKNKLEQIALAGHERCVSNGYFTEPTLEKILDSAINGRF